MDTLRTRLTYEYDSTSAFLVYAHKNDHSRKDSSENIANDLSKWLNHIGTNLRSDQRPKGSDKGRFFQNLGDDGTVHDIVENQLSLLPSIFNHNAVEKVILCGSDLLQDYVNTLFYQEYLSQIGDIMQEARADTELLKRQIRHIVESASKNPDFHHVMTEIALLNSSLSQHAQSQKLSRIIPIELSGNLDNIFLLSFNHGCHQI